MPNKETVYKNLEDIAPEDIYKCATSIFSDVKVNGEVDNADYEKRLVDGCYSSELSFGAFIDNKMIAIAIIGVGKYQGKMTAYNIITGTLLEHREKKIATALLNAVIKNLKKKKVESFYLEVMMNNPSAIRTYQKCGFETTRTLMSFIGNDIKGKRASVKKCKFEEFDFSKTEPLATFPVAFGNSFECMKQRKNDLDVFYIEKAKVIMAMVVIDSKNNTIRYYADDEKRSNILKIIKKIAIERKKIFFKDFDNGDKELIKILNNEGFKNLANQYEMRILFE